MIFYILLLLTLKPMLRSDIKTAVAFYSSTGLYLYFAKKATSTPVPVYGLAHVVKSTVLLILERNISDLVWSIKSPTGAFGSAIFCPCFVL
jgi:hypothetical protein